MKFGYQTLKNAAIQTGWQRFAVKNYTIAQVMMAIL